MRNVRTFFDQLASDLELYIQHTVKYDLPDSNGTTKRQHLTSFRRQLEKSGKSKEALDKQFAELEVPSVSTTGKYLLNIFSELSTARQNGMNGPMPITYTEIKAYNELTDAALEPWEVDAIRLMDRVFIQETSMIINKEPKK